jgi:predicted RNase H-like HicB family nuclease
MERRRQLLCCVLPEWEGLVGQPFTDGATYAEAAEHGQEVLEMLIESYQQEGKTLPEPQTYKGDD